ncbi:MULTISPECIES: DUF1415 domain-containing protein [Thalassotalea]|uniref:DUF1415 domain-containing protein n=1 Tax=Thalassotalea TaxID=1518149 RepID=UPI000943CDDF|nr:MULTISPECIES: DUF1415 domain-containing protein [Thalassotalea]OKY27801.1 hypothetical protein BI291_07760 [Thalassotalea sp. PP2-459]
MDKLTPEEAVKATRLWLEKIVVALNFCPFAKKELINETIEYHVCESRRFTPALEAFILQVEKLVKLPEVETTLVIFNQGFNDFEDFLALVDYANDLLNDCGYEGIFQIATFHPDYTFEGEEPSNASHYTNRSPLPILHILREASMEKALKSYKQPELIPEENITLANNKGTQYFKAVLDDILQQVHNKKK